MKSVILAWILAAGSIFAADIESFKLKNGLQVVLRPNYESEDEVAFAMMAKGGFSVLPESEQVSGRVSADVVWEAGFNGLNADQISNLLYEDYSEMVIGIDPFSRKIEGSTYEEGLLTCIKLIRNIFTKPDLDRVESAFKALEPSYNPEVTDEDLTFDAQVKLINTQNYPPFKPICKKDLKNVDLKVLSQFFKEAFSHLDEFVIVVAGDFKPENVRPWFEKHLGDITSEAPSLFKLPVFPRFPEGITTKQVQLKNRLVQATRLSFPLDFVFSEKHVNELEYTCEVIEARLRKLKSPNWLSSGIDVGYELPFYPYTSAVWLSIQMHVSNAYSEELSQAILKEISNLIETGPTEDELKKALDQVTRSDEFWQRDNTYLSGELINLLLWGWDVKSLDRHNHTVYSRNTVQNRLKEWVNLNHYSKISTK